jgi:hypothetical protein
MIAAALLCVIASGCADQPPTGPKLPRVARSYSETFNKFFIAWSKRGYSSSPIETQMFALDTRQERQWAEFFADQSVLSFASANPGRLYINGDEPDQLCIAPYDYAGIYHDFVAAVRRADPTARVSPAGFAEPNAHCCPVEDVVCSNIHGIGYADQFYKAYVERYGVAPPVNEWRFHEFALSFAVGDMNGWWSRVDSLATWSVSHGANMVLGAWGFLGWREPVSAHQEHLKQGMGRLINDERINGAVYWAYEQLAGEHHNLLDADGSLTPEGQTYANPLTDIPAGVEIVGSANGQAKLRWDNTSSAWAAEAEFWVQARGSNSFVYHKTELVTAPGGAQTPSVVFNIGDSVKGRVRYYNVFGQAAWSSFSNTVSTAKAAKGPSFCFLRLC